jgi:aspartyl-tRNA(Asn)/glutamyl-tRNA(Gln) amidotransferase subunit C
MHINRNNIKYVANLARINLTAQEQELFASQLSDILAYIDKLNKLNTDNIEPMSHAVGMSNVFRKDKPKKSLPASETLQNSPQAKDNFFKVPKIIE